MKSAVPVRETPPPESPVLTPFSTRKPASVKDFPASRAALLCPGTNRRNLPCQQLEIVLSRDRHVGSNPTVSATRLSLDACRVQALFLCQNERTASQPLQTDRVSKKSRMHLHSGFFLFAFHVSLPLPLICTPPVFSHSTGTTVRIRPSTSRLQLWQRRVSPAEGIRVILEIISIEFGDLL